MSEKTISDWLDQLAERDELGRAEALQALRDYRQAAISHDEGLSIIAAAARSYPETVGDTGSVGAELLWIIYTNARPVFIAPLVAHFAAFDREAREMALMTLSLIEDRAAAEAIMSLLTTYAPAGAIDSLPFRPLERKPRHADVFFPEILTLIEYPAFRQPVILLTLAYLNAGALSPADLAPATPALLAAARELLSAAQDGEATGDPDYYLTEAYSQTRMELTIFLDLLAHLGLPEFEDLLREALTLTDPRPLQAIILGLLSRGVEPPTAAIGRVAASLETRSWLYEAIYETDWLRLFPKEYLDQKILAESDLAIWLSYPSALNHFPHQIEFMKVVPYKLGTDILDFFVFRFRAAEGGDWLAGVSGPFSRRKEMRGRATGTASLFERYDDATPGEHVDRLLDQLQAMTGGTVG